jgi:putative copper export protein
MLVAEADVWQGLQYVHLLSMAFFVGGQIVVGVAVVPAFRGDPDRERLRAIARRFSYGSVVAIILLLATGIALASHWGLWGSETLRIKLGLVAAVLVLTGLHLWKPRVHALQGALLLLSLVVVWLGVSLAH